MKNPIGSVYVWRKGARVETEQSAKRWQEHVNDGPFLAPIESVRRRERINEARRRLRPAIREFLFWLLFVFLILATALLQF